MIGRPYKTVYAGASGNPVSISYYNVLGQMTNQVDPDGVSTLYAYNSKGEQTYTVIDSNRNYIIDFTGSDRITFVTNDVASDNGTTVRRTRTYVWATGADAATLTSTAETSVDGLQSWSTIWNIGTPVTSHSQTVYDAAHGYRYLTNTAPDGSFTLNTFLNGLLVSTLSKDANGNQLGQTTLAYDAHARQNRITDARTGTTTNFFNNADQVSGTATPAPAAGQGSQVTTNFFDNMGRIWKTTFPDNTSVTNEFYPTGLLKRTYGSRTYPVAYGYDAQGRVKTMTNWTSFATGAGARVTTWNYDTFRGWLANKTYDANTTGPTYTYTAGGRLQTRLWARGTNTTYSYNNVGELSSVAYNDGATPTVSYNYDRRGRQTVIINGSITCTLAYDAAGNLLSESYSGGPLDGVSVTNGYDQLLRRTNLAALNASTLVTLSTFSYDAASRLHSVGSGTASATYSYLANSPLVSQIAFTNSGAWRMTTTKSYDNLNRLTRISSVPSASSAVTFTYSYNAANQRAAVTNADGSYWAYSYDRLGQVTSGKKYWSDGTRVAGQQFDYVFDDIANRTWTTNNSRAAQYLANNLNQYTNRDVPPYVDMLGSANSNATVTLWRADGSYATTTRQGAYYFGEFPVINSTGAVWLTLTNIAALQNGSSPDYLSTVAANAFVPKAPELFTYDADGNLTSDSRWTYGWDAENRLTTVTSLSTGPAASKLRLDFTYDYQGRRIQKIVSTWSLSAYIPQSTNRFAYDAWNQIATLNFQSAPLQSFTWGLDLSGTQGAGGVGGLLVVADMSLGSHLAAQDGNGNVAALADSASGTTSANYEYGPFGEVIRSTGPMANVNPFRFSTEYFDDESGTVMHPHRPYSPSRGRWLLRDPIEEVGGLNLYAFVANDPIDLVDYLGLLDSGRITIVANGPSGSDGWNVRFRWTPPNDVGCRCTKAVWVQDKDDTVETLLFRYHSLGVDWDERTYTYPQQQSDLWTSGGLLKDMDMWDTPTLTAISRPTAIWRRFKATSRVKCIEGSDRGSFYGTVKWWYNWDKNPRPQLKGGAVKSIGPIAQD
jgi:RHS repeat-associated protein